MPHYDYLVVGAGLFGSVFAHEMHKRGKKVLVIDAREHIGGNCYTEKVEGIQVHKYGPHIFHTNDERIWKYVQKFTRFNSYTHRHKVRYGDRIFTLPINLMTMHQLWGVKTRAEAEHKLAEVRLPGQDQSNIEGFCLANLGEEIYQTFIYGYTKKQWKREPRELPASIIRRLPIRLTFDDRYFFDEYQGIPVGGYTAIFEKLLEGIEVRTNERLYGNWQSIADKLVYTGKIDEFFGYKHGELDYLTLNFDTKVMDGDFQGAALVGYPQYEVPYTRITEHKHFEYLESDKTVVTWEYPVEYKRGMVPYYPVVDTENTEKYQLYVQEKAGLGNVVFGGRLATFKYYDMHQVIAAALVAAGKELGEEWTSVSTS